MSRLRRITLTVLLLPAAAGAQNLLSVWQAAVAHDGQMAVARAAHDASQALADQATALGRPQVGLSLAAGAGANETAMRGARFSAPALGAQPVDRARFATSVVPGLASEVALQARQPLIDAGRDAQQEQLRLGARMGDTQWQAQHGALALATAQRYFTLALAQARVRILDGQALALQRARTEAHDRYQLGDLPITDVHEADAALAAVQAQRAAAGLELDTARRTLADSTRFVQPVAQLPTGALPAAAGWPHWQQAIAQHNPQLHLLRQAVDLAGHKLREQGAMGKPTLDLVAQATQQRLAGRGSYGSARNGERSAMVGLQLTIPLFTGGMASAREREAAHRLAQVQAELDLAQQELERQGRAAWQGLDVGAARIAALQENRTATLARLDATQLGHAVGDRTTLDVLNAQNATAQAELELAQAQVEQVLARLQLAALADQLDEALLTQINAVLDTGPQTDVKEAQP